MKFTAESENLCRTGLKAHPEGFDVLHFERTEFRSTKDSRSHNGKRFDERQVGFQKEVSAVALREMRRTLTIVPVVTTAFRRFGSSFASSANLNITDPAEQPRRENWRNRQKLRLLQWTGPCANQAHRLSRLPQDILLDGQIRPNLSP